MNISIYFSNKNRWIVPVFFFLFALLLRLYKLDFSFSNDELSAILRAKQPNFHDLIQKGVRVDGHPAGVEILLYFWIKLFGTSEFTIRLPFAIMSSLAVVFAYLFARKRFGITTALMIASSLTVLEFPLLYGQIARPYASGIFLSTLLAWSWDKVISPNNFKRKYIVLYSSIFTLVLTLNAYNHYFSALFATIVFISGYAYVKRKQFIAYSIIGLVSVILFLPHLGISLQQYSYGGVGEWLAPPKWNFFYEHLIFIFNDSLVLLLVTIAFVVSFHLVSEKWNKDLYKDRIILAIWFLLPLLIGYFYSIFRNPVLQDRVLIFSMPFSLIFIFSFTPRATKKWQFIVIWLAFIVFAVHTIFIKSYYKQQHFIDFKGIARSYQNTRSEIPSGNILSFAHINSPKYLQFYLDNKNTNFAMDEISSAQDLKKLQIILDTTNANYIDYSVLKPQNRIAMMMIESRFRFRVLSMRDKWSNGYYLFKKETNKNPLDATEFEGNYFYQDIIAQDISEKEYSHSTAFDVNKAGDYNLYLKLLFRSDIMFDNVKIVITKSENNESTEWFAIPLNYFEHSDNDWNIVDFDYPIKMKKGEILKVYIWNQGKEKIEVKDYQIGIKK